MKDDGPFAVFAELHGKAGVRLFTVTAVDRAAGVARRAYSSDPESYPVTGTKPIGSDAWSRQVLDEGRAFIANSTADFAPYFGDHALINALGCQSALNVPVLADGMVVGTVNMLDVEGHFDPSRVAALEALIAQEQAPLRAAFAALTRAA